MVANTKQRVGEIYNANTPETLNLLEYHRQIRSALNRQYFDAITSQSFKMKDSIYTDAAKVVGKAAGLIPVVGGMISNFIGITATAGEAWRQNDKKKGYENIIDLFPNLDPSEFGNFSKKLAEELVNRKSEEIKKLSQDDLRKEIEKDSQQILGLMNSGQCPKTNPESLKQFLANQIKFKNTATIDKNDQQENNQTKPANDLPEKPKTNKESVLSVADYDKETKRYEIKDNVTTKDLKDACDGISNDRLKSRLIASYILKNHSETKEIENLISSVDPRLIKFSTIKNIEKESDQEAKLDNMIFALKNNLLKINYNEQENLPEIAKLCSEVGLDLDQKNIASLCESLYPQDEYLQTKLQKCIGKQLQDDELKKAPITLELNKEDLCDLSKLIIEMKSNKVFAKDDFDIGLKKEISSKETLRSRDTSDMGR